MAKAKQEDNWDVFDKALVDKALDYAPVVGAVAGGMAGKKLLGKTASRELKVKDTETGIEYTMETGKKADFARGVISEKSPLARSTRGRKPGDQVVIKTPAGERQYRVLQNAGGSHVARNSAAYAAGGVTGAAASYEAANQVRKRRK